MKLTTKKIPFSVVVVSISLTLAGATYCETSSLQGQDRKPQENFSCVRCHTDKATLLAIADKAGDPLYLVHHGDLTYSQLKKLIAAPSIKANYTNLSTKPQNACPSYH